MEAYSKKLIKTYKLKEGSKILDVGCGKGYLLKEMLDIQPKLKIYGVEPSNHANKFIDKRIKKYIKAKAQKNCLLKINFLTW